MRYEIIGGQLPAVVVKLQSGEGMFTESGGMCWMSSNMSMKTNTKGGLLKGLGRSLAGESLFMTTYTCEGGEGEIAFGSSFPGQILPLELAAGQSMIVQKNSFLAATQDVSVQMHFNKKMGAGFFGGEGFVLQKITGPGIAFLEIDGGIVERVLAPGEKLKVDQGYFAMFEPTVDFSIEMVKGLSNVLFSGEGLVVSTLTGPGKVWLQTMPYSVLAGRIAAFVNTGR